MEGLVQTQVTCTVKVSACFSEVMCSAATWTWTGDLLHLRLTSHFGQCLNGAMATAHVPNPQGHCYWDLCRIPKGQAPVLQGVVLAHVGEGEGLRLGHSRGCPRIQAEKGTLCVHAPCHWFALRWRSRIHKKP